MRLLFFVLCCLYTSNIFAQLHEFQNGNPANASQINENFDYLEGKINNIENSVVDVNNHINSAVAHDTSSDIVGISDNQTLTNKRLNSPKINEDVELIAKSTELNLLSGLTGKLGSNSLSEAFFVRRELGSWYSTDAIVAPYTDVEFDINDSYDPTTFRFTPKIAGYYALAGSICFYNGTYSGETAVSASIRKNGTMRNRTRIKFTESGTYNIYNSTALVFDLVYANGTTDYFDLYAYTYSAKYTSLTAFPECNYFLGFLLSN